MIKIDVISDTICPWCFIGKRNFDKAISLVPDIDVKFTYSTFQLNPDFPKEGVNKKEYISRKFNENHHSTMKERIKSEAIKSGISIINSKLDIIPNTFNSHKLIYWSKEYDCHTEVVENLFKAYFEKSKDISNIDILLEIAEDSGLNKEEIRKEKHPYWVTNLTFNNKGVGSSTNSKVKIYAVNYNILKIMSGQASVVYQN